MMPVIINRVFAYKFSHVEVSMNVVNLSLCVSVKKTSLLQWSKHYEDKKQKWQKDEGKLSYKDVHLIERNMGTENKITKW